MTKKRVMPADGSPVTGPALLDHAVCFAVYSAGLAFNRVYKPILDQFGLTYPQYLVMIALWQAEGQTVSELGEHLFLESNTLTPLLKRLEAAGFVTRKRDEADERQVRISLTAKGRKVLEESSCVPQQIFEAAGMPAEKLAALRSTLADLRDNLRSAVEKA